MSSTSSYTVSLLLLNLNSCPQIVSQGQPSQRELVFLFKFLLRILWPCILDQILRMLKLFHAGFWFQAFLLKEPVCTYFLEIPNANIASRQQTFSGTWWCPKICRWIRRQFSGHHEVLQKVECSKQFSVSPVCC